MNKIKKLLISCCLVLPLVSCGTTLRLEAWQAPEHNVAPGSIIAFYEKGEYVHPKYEDGSDLWNIIANDMKEIITVSDIHYIHDGYFPRVDYAVDLRWYYKGNGGSPWVSCQIYEGPSQFRTYLKDMSVRKIYDYDTDMIDRNTKKVGYALCPARRDLKFSVSVPSSAPQLQAALDAAKNGNWASAASKAQAYVNSNSHDPEGHHMLGICYMYNRMYAAAVEQFSAANRISPASRYKKALKYAESALKAQNVYKRVI